MPVFIDGRELKTEARALIRTAQVPPLRLTLLLLALSLGLSLLSAVVTFFAGEGTVVPLAQLGYSVSIPPLPAVFVAMLIELLTAVLRVGFAGCCLRFLRGETASYANLFDAFPFAGQVALLTILQDVLIGAGLSLFLVPGVLAALIYSLAPLFLCDDPDAGAFAAMRRSRRALRGYKGQLFTLLLSFLPLLLLVGLPVMACEYALTAVLPASGVGDLLYVLLTGVVESAAMLYLTPYLTLTLCGFYRRIAGSPSADASDGDAPF
jgi:uncharacterized membrane protein